MDLGLTGKTAIVTGGTGGVGAGIVEALAEEGVTVFAVGRDPQRGTRYSSDLQRKGLPVDFVEGDVTDPTSLDAVARQLADRAARVDIVVNNVGGLANMSGGTRGWTGIPDSEWLDTFAKTVISAVAVSRLFIPAMRENGWGRVINIGSIAANEPPASTPGDYGAAKAALKNATYSLAHALAGTGITANLVSPGPILTDELIKHIGNIAANRGWTGDFSLWERRYLEEIRPNAVGRIGRPADIGKAVAFLASEHASYVTGADIRIDGGSSRAVA
ncbi:MAG: short-chain dehydrogenase [Alphaproteobacteria bacterium HGW-Alphaproteobacteria-13]|jgi:NAD(P)-dependent dehydrogenase (short-subunit alcohol dehydrogenase family)|nr:MAG: short-chain dehydrogenase [Alphaproteobacteria bacterium HGW-Alphaproteobacteria-13]